MQHNEPTGIFLQNADMNVVMGRIGTVPIFLNDLDAVTELGRKRIEELTRSNYDTDTLNILPSCDFGCTTGRRRLNRRCKVCETIVTTTTERAIQSDVWFRPPRGVKSLMLPNAWRMISEVFGMKDFNVLEWICIPTTKTAVKRTELVELLKARGVPRGWNNFVDNFDFIMSVLCDSKLGLTSRESRADVMQYITENRKTIFTQYLPIPNKIAFITEKTAVGTYADGGMISGQDAINTICSIDESDGGDTQLVKENKTVRTIMQLAMYYDRQEKTVLGKKSGWFRKQIFGTRVGYGGRAVITSLSAKHDYDELHVPWTFAVAMLKVHITNKLLKMGWNPIQIERYILEKAQVYDPLLDSIMDQLKAESPYKGIPCTFQRNPSLHRGSMQMFYITHVKKDVSDVTISMSVLVLKACNADRFNLNIIASLLRRLVCGVGKNALNSLATITFRGWMKSLSMKLDT